MGWDALCVKPSTELMKAAKEICNKNRYREGNNANNTAADHDDIIAPSIILHTASVMIVDQKKGKVMIILIALP